MKNDTLSGREREILYLIAYEYTNKEISEKLLLPIKTIAAYRSQILSKLSAKNSAGIVRIAYEKKILILDEDRNIVLNKNFLN